MSDDELKALNVARVELGQQMLASLESLMADFKDKTGFEVRDVALHTRDQARMDGTRHCVIELIDVQLDVPIKQGDGVITFAQYIF